MRKQLLSINLLLALSLWVAQASPVKGKVSDTTGNPVAGVVVTDGQLFTTTNHLGEYNLDSDLDKSRFVYLSVPATHEVPTSGGLADQFYQELDKSEEINVHNFTLRKKEQPQNGFVYLAISDPQVMNEEHMGRFQAETITDLKETTARFPGKEIYGVTLGDLVWDAMELYAPYKEAISNLGVTMFSVIGNHDHDLRYTGRSNQVTPSEGYAEQLFENHFGPYNYSFNVGNVHIVSLKDIDYHKDKKYDERFGPETLEWLRKDVSYVKPGSIVFINVHAPVFNHTDQSRANAEDAELLKEIVAPFDTHIFAGHTHFFENSEVTPSLYEHNIGAACGAWWAGNVNRCGAPNGYLVVEVEGDSVSWHYKATGQTPDYQFRIYKPGEFKSQPGYLVANLWDWDSAYQVKWYEDGKEKGPMEAFDDEDQAYIDMMGKGNGYHTLHLFRCQPSPGSKEIKIEVVNRFGEICDQNEILP